MQFDIITGSIVAIPAVYSLIIGFQFIKGLVMLWQSDRPATAPQMPNLNHVAPTSFPSAAHDQVEDPWSLPCAVVDAPVEPIAEVTPVVPAALPSAATPIALLPAFVAAVQVEATADDHALVEDGWMRHYCTAGMEDVIVKFDRPVRATQKPQQQHLTIEGMTVHQMRKLGTSLKIRGARRWNTVQAIEALTRYYSTAA